MSAASSVRRNTARSRAKKLAGAERLREVVVRAHLQADDAIGFVTLGGEHDHRDTALLTDPLERLQAVELRHHHVQQHRVERRRRERLEPAAPVIGVHRDDAVRLEVAREQLEQASVVIDDQDA